MLALVVAILCVNLKVPGRTSQESNENPNVCSCLQIPPLGKSFKLGEVSWEDPWQCGFAGKSGGWRPSCRGGAAMSGGGWRAALALLFPLTLSRKLQRKPWEERKGNFNGGTV